MNGLHYLLQVNICLLLFYSFYALMLKNETFFGLNRAYLIFTGLASFSIPLIQSEQITELFVNSPGKRAGETFNYAVRAADFIVLPPIQAAGLSQEPIDRLSVGDCFFIIYIAGVFFFFARFVWRTIAVYKTGGPAKHQAYSFFNKIVVSENIDQYDTIYQHEKVHAKQLHSADVILFETISIINWLNPVAYFYKKAIQSVHEFIADEQASSLQKNKKEYALILLGDVFGIESHQLANNFYRKSLLKTRIEMLYRPKSGRAAFIKYGLSLFMVAVLLVLSSATIATNTNLQQLSEGILKKDVQIGELFTRPRVQPYQKSATISPRSIAPAPLTGNVKNASGKALAGVKISYLKTGMLYFTDADGSFRIPEYFPNDQLSFEYGGYKDLSFITSNVGKSPVTYGPYTIVLTVMKPLEPGTPKATRSSRVLGKMPTVILDGTIIENKDAATQYEVGSSFDYVAKIAGIERSSILAISEISDSVSIAKYGVKNKEGILYATTHKVSFSKTDTAELYVSPQIAPQFPGGVNALTQVFRKNFSNSIESQKAGRNETLYMKFIVEKDGSLTNINITRIKYSNQGGGSATWSEKIEAQALLQSLPKWKPAEQNGQIVRSGYKLSVVLEDPTAAK